MKLEKWFEIEVFNISHICIDMPIVSFKRIMMFPYMALAAKPVDDTMIKYDNLIVVFNGELARGSFFVPQILYSKAMFFEERIESQFCGLCFSFYTMFGKSKNFSCFLDD